MLKTKEKHGSDRTQVFQCSRQASCTSAPPSLVLLWELSLLANCFCHMNLGVLNSRLAQKKSPNGPSFKQLLKLDTLG